MKRTLPFLAAIVFCAPAFAGQSDRYHDLRLDTSIKTDAQSASVSERQNTGQLTLSSRNKDKKKTYPYINPYGVGPNNDSR